MGLTKKLIAKELSKNIDISNEESLNFLNHFINYIKDIFHLYIFAQHQTSVKLKS